MSTLVLIILAACQGGLPTVEPSAPAGRDITVNLPRGDAERGGELALSKGCLACHAGAAGIGPDWQPTDALPGIGARAALRPGQNDYTGQATNAHQYLFESIALPGAYLVEGFSEGVMPDGFGNLATAQDMADIIAFLLTIQ
jgi:cytochrome c2